MQIISWNVASVRARLNLLIELLNDKKPDIVLLQEIKTQSETFPSVEIRNAGYYTYINGQKGFNGVAILSKTPLTDIITNLFDTNIDEQARFIQASDHLHTFICVYVPNGSPPMNNPTDTSRLAYKIQWMNRLNNHLKFLSDSGKQIILGGDFNVIVQDDDVYDTASFEGGALMIQPVRDCFNDIMTTPLVNTLRHSHPNEKMYSFWDFQMGAARRNLGILLDYIFIPPSLLPALQDSGIYKEYRYKEKPSDHAPVYCILKDI